MRLSLTFFIYLEFQVYCKVCYLRNYGPGGKNKYGEKTKFETDEDDAEACVRCKGKVGGIYINSQLCR